MFDDRKAETLDKENSFSFLKVLVLERIEKRNQIVEKQM